MKNYFIKLIAIAYCCLLLNCTANNGGSPDPLVTNPPNNTTTGPLFIMGNGVTDVDGNQYPTIKINGQEWMQKNLNVSKYRNGDVIPHVVNGAQWNSLTTGAWCYYEHSTANGIIYGKLYNWYAVNDPRGLAPTGWHVSTNDDWTILTTFLGGSSKATDKLKDVSNLYWTYPTGRETNSSGLTLLPAGQATGGGISNGFFELGTWANFWTSTTIVLNNIQNGYASIIGSSVTFAPSQYIDEKHGYSVRCLKN